MQIYDRKVRFSKSQGFEGWFLSLIEVSSFDLSRMANLHYQLIDITKVFAYHSHTDIVLQFL